MKSIMGLIVSFLSFFSCSDDAVPLAGDSVDISVSTFSFDAGIHSRTSMTGSKAAFTSGDAIGVFETLTGRQNIAFSYNGTSWTTPTPLYWYNGTSQHTFYAYYPYNSSSQGMLVSLPVLSQQQVSTVPDASCDMLITSSPTSQARSGGTSVSMTMKHAFALLRFDIKMSVLSLINPYKLDSLLVRGGNPTGGNAPYGMFNKVNQINSINYNLSSNTLQLPVNNSTTCAQLLRTAPPSVNILTTSVSVYTLILPGTYTNPVPAIRLNLSTLGILSRNTGYLTLPNASSFTAGNMYVYQVSIGLNLLGRSKTEIQKKGEYSLLPAEVRQSSP